MLAKNQIRANSFFTKITVTKVKKKVLSQQNWQFSKFVNFDIVAAIEYILHFRFSEKILIFKIFR